MVSRCKGPIAGQSQTVVASNESLPIPVRDFARHMFLSLFEGNIHVPIKARQNTWMKSISRLRTLIETAGFSNRDSLPRRVI